MTRKKDTMGESKGIERDGGTVGAGLIDAERTAGYPVLIIPGYGAPSYQTDLVGRSLESFGLDVVKVKLPWLAMGDMVRSAHILSEQVERVRDGWGFDRVNLFGFSLGGLIARYYLQELEGHLALGRGAFVASPHAGTYIGYLGFFSPAGRQVRPGSAFLRGLTEAPGRDCFAGRCLSIYVRWDGVIIPSGSAYMPGGYNLMCSRPLSHWRAVTSRDIMLRASEFLLGGIPEGSVPGHELALPEAGGVLAIPPDFHPVERAGVWRVIVKPLKSLAGKIASIFRRK